jgi:RNA polymerase sigma-70 factor (ECF subfamily)
MTDKMSNRKLLSLSDDGEFKKLFEDFYIPLCVFAHKYVDDIELSADIVQDCFMSSRPAHFSASLSQNRA